jgi:hypothetical protein
LLIMIILDGVFGIHWGASGPILIDLAKYALSPSLMDKYKKIDFWLGLFALLLVSGFVTILNGTEHVPLIRAVQLGINAPAFLEVRGIANTRFLDFDNIPFRLSRLYG